MYHIFHHAQSTPDKPAIIMGESGQSISYKQLNDYSNQIAQLCRSLDVKRGDNILIFMDNTPQFFEICWAASRSGLYYTAVSSRLTASEVAYIAKDCEAKIIFSSDVLGKVAQALPKLLPDIKHWYMLGEPVKGYDNYITARNKMPAQPIADESPGMFMLYSSGTTGRPKGIRRELQAGPIDEINPLIMLVTALYGMDAQTHYLSPAPLYHAAPLAYNIAVQSVGGTCYIMENFDAEAALRLIDKHKPTHSQWVPTMFIRMLKLPEAVRKKYDISSMICAIHAAAPCPVHVKQQMIDWWGEVIFEYYAGTEGNGFCAITPQEWLKHKGSVGKALLGTLHICEEDSGKELPNGEAGLIYFESDTSDFSYYKDDEKTKSSRHPNGQWTTLGDVGYVNDEGYLFLTDRKAFMIISGGVNIYPQEIEDVLIGHPKVADVAVFGVPNEEFGEEVKAVVQPMQWPPATDDLSAELMGFCKDNLSSIKCPRSIDFQKDLPRHPTGKLYKRLLRDQYWGKKDSKIVS